MIKSHEANEKTEESKDSVESTQKEEKRPRSPTPPPARRSPEPSCAICLEHLTNKSFTDSCFHMFCYTCLVEWSKVKPECPLCKKSFSSIVHNVKSFTDFDRYFVKAKIDDSRSCMRRFTYRTTLTPERLTDNTRDVREISASYLSHRLRFAPHSMNNFRLSFATSPPSRRIPNSFRQRVYDENLWVFPLNSNRVRIISPEFFRQNIACTHRLLPWLNRELLVVMPNNENQIAFVVELIMALIVKYDIRSQEFYTLIEPYTASHTSHFIHEFYNFAISPYETLESYDIYARYDPSPIRTYERASSPDSDVIPLPMDYSTSLQQNTSDEASKKKKQSKKKHAKECRKLKKIVLKRNSEKNIWENINSSIPFINSNFITGSLSYELAGPSTSRGIPFITDLSNVPIPSTEIDITSVDDEECQVLDVLKPKSERTPEIVHLSSDDDVPHIVSEDDTDKISIISVIGAETKKIPISDNECEVLFFKESEKPSNTNTTSTNEIVFDKPIDYSFKSFEKQPDIESKVENIEPCTSNIDPFKDYAQDVSQLPIIVCDPKLEVIKPERSTVIKSVVRAVAKEDNASSSLSPKLKPKKRRALIIDDGSTDSCSDSAQVTDIVGRRKKMKLQSVVARYTVEDSDDNDSPHRSMVHKKHRERKKKKKKHKHRRRIYSSDSD